MSKVKKLKNIYEGRNIDELFEFLKPIEEEFQDLIDKHNAMHQDIMTELNKWSVGAKPNIKRIEEAIKKQEPGVKRFNELGVKREDIKKEIIKLTGLKEAQLKGFHEFYKFNKTLQQSREPFGVI
jgi:DNA-binding transcriptional regulator GbsR (MarR family)